MYLKPIVLFVFFVSFHVNISAHTLYVNETNSLDNFSVYMYQDTSSKLTIDDMQKIKNFTKIPNRFSLGYKNGNIWLKFSLKNITSKRISKVIHFSEDFYDTFDFYILKQANRSFSHPRLQNHF